MKSKSKLTYQNYGTSILIFIQGETQEDAYGQWLSLWNWGGTTSEEPKWVAENVCACWSKIPLFQRYLFNIMENRLWHNSSPFKGAMDLCCKAREMAKAAFEATTTESFRSINNDASPYEFGVIAAEKPDDDFADAVLSYAFSHHRDHIA